MADRRGARRRELVADMSEIINALAVRKRLGREIWATPYRYGADTWVFDNFDGRTRILVSDDPVAEPGVMWVHASISDRHAMPTYHQLKMMHDAVFDGGWAYQVFTPPSDHINIHNYCLHLFGRIDGKPALPDFTQGSGSI